MGIIKVTCLEQWLTFLESELSWAEFEDIFHTWEWSNNDVTPVRFVDQCSETILSSWIYAKILPRIA